PGSLPPGVERIDPATFRQHQTEEAQALSRQTNDLRRQLFKPDGGVPPQQYEVLLRPLARRLFLSTRFPEVLQNRLHGKSGARAGIRTRGAGSGGARRPSPAEGPVASATGKRKDG